MCMRYALEHGCSVNARDLSTAFHKPSLQRWNSYHSSRHRGHYKCFKYVFKNVVMDEHDKLELLNTPLIRYINLQDTDWRGLFYMDLKSLPELEKRVKVAKEHLACKVNKCTQYLCKETSLVSQDIVQYSLAPLI